MAELLWEPDAAWTESSALGRFARRAAARGALTRPEWPELWSWSVSALDEFWSAVAESAGMVWSTPPSRYFAGDPALGAGPQPAGTWCPGGRCSYAAQALQWAARPEVAGAPAIVAYSQTREPSTLGWSELAAAVSRAATGLRRAGVEPGDRVAGYLPNIPEAIIAFLAAASIGAVWTGCAPETGVHGVLARFAQVAPTVLVAVDGYRYGERRVERVAEIRQIVEGLASLRRTVVLGYLDATPALDDGWWSWDTLLSEAPAGTEGAPVPLDFDHPLYVLYSSGTTGAPKAIVHSHGGITLEHLKTMHLHNDLGPADRLYWATTTGWMMWNYVVSGLLVGATVVCSDGDFAYPGAAAMWDLVAESRATMAGMGAGHLVAFERAGLEPARTHDLSALRVLGSTGSPLPASAARWVYRSAVGSSTALASMSGGTDVCSGFVGWTPWHRVWAGEISCRCLGAAVEVLDDQARPVVGQEGELVVAAPMPSMPLGFWGDDDGSRYRGTYFDQHPGYWTHGDRMTLTERGTCVITGRSDGTLNRGGVRMGTAEFYDVLGQAPEVADSLVIHVEDPDGGPGTLWCFVVVAPGVVFDDELRAKLRSLLRNGLSPRHVPDRIEAVSAVPRTLSGKKLEVPIKRILGGVPPEQALRRDAVANPEVLDEYLAKFRV